VQRWLLLLRRRSRSGEATAFASGLHSEEREKKKEEKVIGLFFKQSCSFLFHLFFLSITRRNFKKQTRTHTRSSKTYTRKKTATNKVKANRNDDDQSGGGNTQRR